jgi:hypothetical protein
MNIAMEQTEEYVDGQLKSKYGDCFIRGNNGMLLCCTALSCLCSVSLQYCCTMLMYIFCSYSTLHLESEEIVT